MALESVMDAIAVRLASGLSANSDSGTAGLRAAYSAGSTAQGASIIPRSIDDWPVAIVWAGGGELQPGNGPEPFRHSIEVQVWTNAAGAAHAYQTLIPFVERMRILFRTDLDANTTAARVLYLGYDQPEVEDSADGQPFLVMTHFLEALEITSTTAYAV